MSRVIARRALVLAALAALVLAGCHHTADFYYVTEPPVLASATPYGIVVALGGSVTIMPFRSSGQESFTVGNATSENAAIATTATTDHEYRVPGEYVFDYAVVVTGVRVGTTKLRLWGDDPDEGTLPITVVQEDP